MDAVLQRRRTLLAMGDSVDWETMYYSLVDGTLSGEVLLPSGLTSVRRYLCYNFTNVDAVTIPSTVTEILSYAFYATKITSINLPSGLTKLDDSALRSTKLTSISLPNTLTYIGNACFRDVTTLNEGIVIPDSVTTLGGQAFYGCNNISYIDVGTGVPTLNSQIFYGCSGLQYVIFRATTPPTLTNANVFTNTNNCLIYVPDNSVSVYQTSWSSLSSRIKPLSELTT